MLVLTLSFAEILRIDIQRGCGDKGLQKHNISSIRPTLTLYIQVGSHWLARLNIISTDILYLAC